jgi:hypothetical protein
MFRERMILILTLGACLLCAQILSGCALFPFAISTGLGHYQEGYVETDIPELAQRQDVTDLAAQVGVSMGYDVSQKSADAIVLSKETVNYIEPVTGEYRASTIVLYKVEKGVKEKSPVKSPEEEIYSRIAPTKFSNETVHLSVYGEGLYYKSDNQQYIGAIMSEFKNKLSSGAIAVRSD